MLALAKEPKYKILYSQLKRENDALKIEHEILKDKILQLSHMVLCKKVGSVMVQNGDSLLEVPAQVAKWMIEYNLPWEVFRCEIHGEWISELDAHFPYHMEMCRCDRCD